MKLVLQTPEFFATPPKKLVVEENPICDRVYFLKGDRIVAVGSRSADHERKDHATN